VVVYHPDHLSAEDVTRTLVPRGSVGDMGIFVDASTSWGIGIDISGHWASFRLSDNWKAEGRDVCWLETLAIELLTYLLEDTSLQNAHLLIHSDNQGAIGALDKGHSRNFHINLSVRRIYTILSSLLIIPPSILLPKLTILRRELGPPDRSYRFTSIS
jgi:hypothetical protein